MKVYKKGENIVFEIPAWTRRRNPYMDDNAQIGSHPTLIGLITKDKHGNEELGFAYVIDMDYKDKADQFTGIMLYWDQGDVEEFKKLCDKLKIGWVDDRLWDSDIDPEND